ncbi:flavin-containing monooxygenase [Nevskia ramosa]|uniref:flavin-containing monooxygenase n=1 Tax=Nevskia ramosa TaxID=64002 RepID=UPI0023536E9F|nr:NAD(P)/FAD-dependent oxidoreductase [Nevskia ramosa]
MSQVQSAAKQVDAVVVGAGFAGMYGIQRLREKGLKVQGFEAGHSVGGTWYWNRYPGARVDSQAYIYQYWFSDELIKEWDWSERFPAQPETEKYLNHVADKFEIRKDFQFETKVEAAKWDDGAKRWTVTTDKGDVVSAQFLLMSTGGLSAPLVPPFKHHEKFKGQIIHTGRWPKEGVDFAGKKVGVIGTGATGIQVVQTIAPQVGQLTVYQRTANYTIPMRNPKYDDADRAGLKAGAKAMHKRVNSTFAGFDYDWQATDLMAMNPEAREAQLNEWFADGSLGFWIGSIQGVLMDESINAVFSDFVKRKIRARVHDPKVADLLVPDDHGFGTRRVPLETKYYEAFNQPNVKLVSVKKTPIVEFTERGIRTTEGEQELDIVIFATGFDAGTGALTRVDVRGEGGQSLRDDWNQHGIHTTMGLQVHGYPNMFMTMAPYSPAAAFCNVPTCLQQQVDWIADCVDYVRKTGKQAIQPGAEIENNWLAHHDEVANLTLVPKTNSWYMGSNVEGKPRRLLAYAGGAQNYRAVCDDLKAKQYQGFEIA